MASNVEKPLDDRVPLDAGNLPRFKPFWHFRAAFGGVLGTLNLLVAAISIARQLVRTFDVGISPVLKSIFAAYVDIFHGAIHLVAELFVRVLGVHLQLPEWTLDWIVLWFVMAGSASRLMLAAFRALDWQAQDADRAVTLFGGPISGVIAAKIRTVRWRGLLIYIISLVLWPVFIFETFAFSPWHFSGKAGAENTDALTSYRALFFIQTLAIIVAIFGLSVLNARTM
jgi:hypothetical protein